ncbi:hypothetical protein LguiA_002965 [Lonicera macranthoides]
MYHHQKTFEWIWQFYDTPSCFLWCIFLLKEELYVAEALHCFHYGHGQFKNHFEC